MIPTLTDLPYRAITSVFPAQEIEAAALDYVQAIKRLRLEQKRPDMNVSRFLVPAKNSQRLTGPGFRCDETRCQGCDEEIAGKRDLFRVKTLAAAAPIAVAINVPRIGLPDQVGAAEGPGRCPMAVTVNSAHQSRVTVKDFP